MCIKIPRNRTGQCSKLINIIIEYIKIKLCTLFLQATQIVSHQCIVCTQQTALGLFGQSTRYALEKGNVENCEIYFFFAGMWHIHMKDKKEQHINHFNYDDAY